MILGTKIVRASGSVAGLGLLAALWGCKVGPNYTPPKVEAPESFTHTGAEGFSATSLVDQQKPLDERWWGQLHDPMLDSLVARAVASNLDVKLASARIREERAQRGVIAPDALPEVDVDALASRSRDSKNTPTTSLLDGRATNLFQGGFDASWELDFFGSVARNVEAADADIQAAQEDRRDVLVTLVSEVARNYVELRGSQQRLAIARQNIDLQKSTLELTRSRFNAGLTSDLDVAQAESSLSTSQSTVPPLDTAIQASIHRLGVLLGRHPSALLAELSPVGAIPKTPDALPVGIPSDLIRRRPDIRRAERQLAASTARIGVATADLFPRFSLTGSFGFAADKVPTLPDASSRFWSFGPAMKWPLLDWGRIRSNIGVQDARTDQALVVYQEAVLNGFEDVENAMTAYTREQDRRKSLAEAVASDQRAFDTANKLYSAGLSDFQRVLDTQRSLFASQDALTDSDRTVTSNLVAIYKALGGGWEMFSPETAAPKKGLPNPSSHFGKSDQGGEDELKQAPAQG